MVAEAGRLQPGAGGVWMLDAQTDKRAEAARDDDARALPLEVKREAEAEHGVAARLEDLPAHLAAHLPKMGWEEDGRRMGGGHSYRTFRPVTVWRRALPESS